MKQKIVGTYELGAEYVQLVAKLDDSGGEFYLMPEKDHIGRIKVGLDYPNWDECVSVLMHEALEYALARNGLRFIPCRSAHIDSSDFIFLLTHQQFALVCREAAMFVTEALPALAAAYKKNRASRKS